MDPQRLLPQSVEEKLLGLLGFLGGAALLGAIALAWASLVSWSINDPSLTHATAADPRNMLGGLGAVVSDLLLQTFGLAAILALLPPMLWGAEMLRSGHLSLGRSKVGYYPIAVLALAGAMSAYPVLPGWPLNHDLGGAIGDGVFSLAANLFKLVNKDRAELAAALLLNTGAVALFAKSAGFDLENWIKALWAERTLQDAGGYAVDRSAGWHKGWRTGIRAAETGIAGDADPAFHEEPPLPYPQTGGHENYARVPAPGWPSDGYAPVAHALDTLAAIAKRQEEHLRILTSRGAAGLHEAPAALGGAPVRHDPVQFAPAGLSPVPNGIDSQPVVFRGDGFDASTDAESMKIAERFAPRSVMPGHLDENERIPASARKLEMPAILKPPPEPRVRQWKRPSLNLLKRPAAARPGPELTQTVMRGNARLLEDVLNDFGVKGEVKDIRPGPVVTLYELEPARGTKSSRVIGLADDIARSMSVVSVRAAVVPGRNAIGLELPNMRREPVSLREMLESEPYRASDAALPLTLGKSIAGDPVVADLARMPHLLVAGTTGSGKSVGVNAFILSLLYRHAPSECRFLMIDPKMLELSVYNGIPHLLTPVVTDPHKAVVALNWAVREMEERYKRMATLSVRNIDVYNNRVRNALKRGEMLSRTVQTGFDKNGQAVFEKQKMTLEPMARIVIVVDEFADLMVVAGKEVEGAVQRLAQMARAAGIHLIMATQRPSVDVITGTIKANFPTRISFKVTSKIDSRTILNEQGAEQLLGQGDMLYSSGSGQIARVHGAFVSDEEVEAVAGALREQGPPQYIEGLLDVPETDVSGSVAGDREVSESDLYDRAVAIVMRDRKPSISYLQRRLSIGYNRAADLIERMEREGLVSQASPTGKREILSGPGGSADAA
ncbi:MAG TPA: DNA translocase FtsK [Hyphomicrobium sp.]|nr:DNA translocase FtsK [Hyphomicrobium sp.]